MSKKNGLASYGIIRLSCELDRKNFMVRKLQNGQGGMTLLEVVISLAILGIVATGFLTGLSTGLYSQVHTEDTINAANLATSQLEYALSQSYIEPPQYSEVTPPQGYSLSSDNSVIDPTLLERITASVSIAGKTLLDVTTLRVTRTT